MIYHHCATHSEEPAVTPVRILIESSEYWLRNNGDLAMLEVTITRLRRRWPDAQIRVLTDVPLLLRAYHPTAKGVTVFASDAWAEPTIAEDFLAALGPRIVGPVVLGLVRFRVWLPQRARGLRRRLERLVRNRLPLQQASDSSVPSRAAGAGRPVHPGSAAAVEKASLLLVLGGGYITDSDGAQAHRVFNLIEHACDNGIPVAMIGQGLGPLDDPILQQRATEVLPRVDFISLRERLRGPKILERAGVPDERILVTGDDAIELAYTESDTGIGADIGVCLRMATYAPVSDAARETVRKVVQTVAYEYSSTLVPLIIAEYRSQDRRSTLPIVRGAWSAAEPLPRYVAPAQIVDQVSQCRVLVTGAYHLAVFALSRGIPVVALSSTRYYDDKFRGLEDLFGGGLTLLHLDDPSLGIKLAAAIRDSWRQAEEVRGRLRGQAREWIRRGHLAFEHVFALAEHTRVEHH
ncbi:polysaccharide pyruvyl transferase family protein [Rhodococcus sp. NPDC047139]|uniref:polysaccharide pyruvyl transferase family protein n=1 Tax=Rhodococcus sp. NPDC047139 TaxID=3155141 RepID=UPI0033F31C3C